MPYHLIDTDPDPTSVRRVTFVPFLPDGRYVALPGPTLLTASVEPNEHYVLDVCLKAPLAALGFRPQRIHPFAADNDHIHVWLDGDHTRPPAIALPTTKAPQVVQDALHSFQTQSDESYYADNVRLLEPAYLRGTTPQSGSGFGGDATRWRARREMIVDGMHRSGTFLDVGCANGLLMESVREWAAERGLTIEPYGVDLAPRLVDLAKRRLPHWSDRIELGNAINYTPTTARHFTFVHVLLDAVPRDRRPDLIHHTLTLVEPTGRLLVSHYQGDGGTDLTAPEHLRALGFKVAGSSQAQGPNRGATTAWLQA